MGRKRKESNIASVMYSYVGTDDQFDNFLKMMLHDYLAVDNPYTAKETEAEEPVAEKPKWQQAM